MKISVITRTCRRPKSLKRAVRSVQSQDHKNVQHIIIRDHIGRGVPWANINLANRNWKDIQGDYVYLLDDDNILLPKALSAISRRLEYTKEDLLFVRIDRNAKQRNFPPDYLWGKEPQFRWIDLANIVTSKELFTTAVKGFTELYEGDFDFITTAWNHSKKTGWLDRRITKLAQNNGAYEQ